MGIRSVVIICVDGALGDFGDDGGFTIIHGEEAVILTVIAATHFHCMVMVIVCSISHSAVRHDYRWFVYGVG